MREYMRGLYSHSREYRKICLSDQFPHSSQILEGIHVHVGANTIFAPVFAPARIQENMPGELCMNWFRARGYMIIDRS